MNDAKPNHVIPKYLDLLATQRETAFAALAGLTDAQIWQRPAPKEWSIGEILNHNYLVMSTAMPYVHFAWRFFCWYGERFRARPYKNDIPDLYRDGKFPMWVGFLWTPRHKPGKPVSLEQLKSELRDLHRDVCNFYKGKEEDVLGNIAIFDPYFGWLNLILTLRLGLHHDQLHYEDVIKLAEAVRQPNFQPAGVKPPTGLSRLAFRLPIYLFRAGLGGLLGNRFLLLNHIGRKSGLPRQAVLEVVDYDQATDTYYVASGYGRSAQWFRNIQANPEVTIQVGRRKLAVTAKIFEPEESGEMMVQYAQRHPNAAKNLSRMIGYQVNGSMKGYRQIAAKHIPFVALQPRLLLEEGRPLWPLAVVSAALVGLGWLLRRKRREN